MTGNRQVTRSVAPNYKENIIVIVKTLSRGRKAFILLKGTSAKWAQPIYFAGGNLF